MGWKWRRGHSGGPSYVAAVCLRCGRVVRREGSLFRVLWWTFFGLGDCPDCPEEPR